MTRHPMVEGGSILLLTILFWIFCSLPAAAEASLSLSLPDLDNGDEFRLDDYTLSADLPANGTEDQEKTALQTSPLLLSGSHLPIRFSGDEPLSRTLLFGDQDFQKDDKNESETDIDLYDLTLAWSAVSGKLGSFQFQWGPEVSLKIIDSGVSGRDDMSRTRDSDSLTLPFPTAGAWARLSPADWLDLTGRFGYMEYDRDSLMNGDIRIDMTPATHMGFFLGYRHLDFDVDETGTLIDANMEGFYGGALIRY